MGFRFRKQIKIAPGVKLNINKDSASVSIGPKGLKQTYSTTGKKTTTVGIPGTGLSYSSTERMGKDTATEPKEEPKTTAVPVRDLDHLDENGDIPVGWLYANRNLTEPTKLIYSYLIEKYAEQKKNGVLSKYAALKALVSYIDDIHESCASKGECFKKWADELVDPYFLENYRADLNAMEESMEDLLHKEKVTKQLKIDLLEIIKAEPGVVQSDLYKRFDAELKADISNELYWLSANGTITREKSGRSYKLFIKA